MGQNCVVEGYSDEEEDPTEEQPLRLENNNKLELPDRERSSELVSFIEWDQMCPQILSVKEKKLIRDTWEAIGAQPTDDQDKLNSHERFFQRVWIDSTKRSPKIRSIFGFSNNTSEAEMKESEKLMHVVRSVTVFFQRLIENYNLDTAVVISDAIDLGARHVHYGNGGFQPVFWDIFLVSLVHSLETSQLLGPKSKRRWRSVYAWHKFTHFLVNQMLESYREARL